MNTLQLCCCQDRHSQLRRIFRHIKKMFFKTKIVILFWKIICLKYSEKGYQDTVFSRQVGSFFKFNISSHKTCLVQLNTVCLLSLLWPYRGCCFYLPWFFFVWTFYPCSVEEELYEVITVSEQYIAKFISSGNENGIFMCFGIFFP